MRNGKTFFDHILVSCQKYYLASFGCCNSDVVHCSLAQLGTYLVSSSGTCTRAYGNRCPSYAALQMTIVLLCWSVCLSWPVVLPVVPRLVVVWQLLWVLAVVWTVVAAPFVGVPVGVVGTLALPYYLWPPEMFLPSDLLLRVLSM